MENSCYRYILGRHICVALIDVHAARGTTAQPEARFFGLAQAQPGLVLCGPRPAWPDVQGRA
jgi:hypothetical protein